jgi:hypothetical protein
MQPNDKRASEDNYKPEESLLDGTRIPPAPRGVELSDIGSAKSVIQQEVSEWRS